MDSAIAPDRRSASVERADSSSVLQGAPTHQVPGLRLGSSSSHAHTAGGHRGRNLRAENRRDPRPFEGAGETPDTAQVAGGGREHHGSRPGTDSERSVDNPPARHARTALPTQLHRRGTQRISHFRMSVQVDLPASARGPPARGQSVMPQIGCCWCHDAARSSSSLLL